MDNSKQTLIKETATVTAEKTQDFSTLTNSAEVPKKKKYFTASRVSKIAIFSALSFVLYMFPKFPLPMLFPSFLEINFSDIPMLIGGFALGPVSGAIIVFVRYLLKLPFSHTATVGELADLLIGLGFVIPASIYYKKHHNKKGAVISLIIGSICSTVMGILSNWLITIPFYVNAMFKGNWDILLNMCSILGNITKENFFKLYLFGAVLPFNLLRCLIAGLLTFVLYKRTSTLINKW